MNRNEAIARVMGWNLDAQRFTFDDSMAGVWMAKLLQAKIVQDGWSVFISHFSQSVKLSLTDPDGVAPGRIHCAAEIEKHPVSGWPGTISAFAENEPAAIVSLFCKVYGIKGE